MGLRIIILICLALVPVGCAKRDSAVESLVGSEPQRLSFGPPAQVEATFIEKMKHCWFAGSNAPLKGYRYETGQRLGEGDSSEGAGAYQTVMIFGHGRRRRTLRGSIPQIQ